MVLNQQNNLAINDYSLMIRQNNFKIYYRDNLIFTLNYNDIYKDIYTNRGFLFLTYNHTIEIIYNTNHDTLKIYKRIQTPNINIYRVDEDSLIEINIENHNFINDLIGHMRGSIQLERNNNNDHNTYNNYSNYHNTNINNHNNTNNFEVTDPLNNPNYRNNNTNNNTNNPTINNNISNNNNPTSNNNNRSKGGKYMKKRTLKKKNQKKRKTRNHVRG